MIKYKACMQYDGTAYQGWQRQGNTENTIQGTIESTLRQVFSQRVELSGSGRTDAGVHARGQMIHFQVYEESLLSEKSIAELKARINQRLPEDIRMLQLDLADPKFHCRYQATAKQYTYHISTGERSPVFRRQYTWHIAEYLDLEAMRRGAEILQGTHNFRGFSTEKDRHKSTVRTIYSIDIIEAGREIQLCCLGNGFLRNMVRIITGTLVEIGLGERPLEDLEKILNQKKRSIAGMAAPPQGLFLDRVFYDESVRMEKAEKNES